MLSVVTGIAPEVWSSEGARAIATALDLLAEIHGHGRADRQPAGDDRVYGG